MSFGRGSANYIDASHESGYFVFQVSNGETAFTINASKEATFADDVTIQGGLTATPLAGGHAVFNEGGIDADFRVESDGNANMIFVNGGNNRVGLGTGSPQQVLEISGGGLQVSGQIISPASGQSAAYFDYSAGGARVWSRGDATTRGTINFYQLENDGGNQITSLSFSTAGAATFSSTIAGTQLYSNTNGNRTTGGNLRIGLTTNNSVKYTSITGTQYAYDTESEGFALITATSADATSNSVVIGGGIDEQNAATAVRIFTAAATTRTGVERLKIDSTGNFTFNETSTDVDFRVESNTNTHALFVDGGNSRVGINQSAPAGDFHVTGGADSLIFIDGTASVANSATTLFTINFPGTANSVFVTLFVHGIATGVAWMAFKQDFVGVKGGVVSAVAGDVVETTGGGTMTLNVSGDDLNVQFNHASASASTVNWSAVIQGKPGTIS